MNREKGSISLEAAVILSIVIVVFFAISSVSLIIKNQIVVQHQLNQSVKKYAQYGYIAAKLKLSKNDEKTVDDLVNSALEFGKSVSSINGIESIERTAEQGKTFYKEVTNTEPEVFFKGLARKGFDAVFVNFVREDFDKNIRKYDWENKGIELEETNVEIDDNNYLIFTLNYKAKGMLFNALTSWGVKKDKLNGRAVAIIRLYVGDGMK